MTARTSQRLIAAAFIVAATSVLLLFLHIWSISGVAPPASLRTLIGALGWIIMVSACAVILFHPKPEDTFLGRFAFQKEPLLRGPTLSPVRVVVTFAVVAVAVLAATVTILAFTGGLNALLEKYVFS
jgi:hypothetical protein